MLVTVFWAESNMMETFLNDPAWDPSSNYGVFVNAGGIWGAIGPAKFFGIGSPYQSLLLGFILGLILPIIPFVLNKIAPHPFWPLINIPLLASSLPTSSNQAVVVVPFLINIIFNKLVFTYNRKWWEKYNFILSVSNLI
jgi:hypothetical protein